MEHYDEKMNYTFEPEENRQSGAYNYAYRQQPAQEEKPKKKHTGLKITALLVAVAIVAGLGGAGLSHIIADISEKNSRQAEKTAAKSQQTEEQETASYQLALSPLPEALPSNAGQKQLTPRDVYAMNVGAVCGITTQITTNIYGQVATAACSGSGFVLTQDGYIVTNNHVVEDATSVTVKLYDGTEYDAQIVGADTMNDVALLKIDAENLQYVHVGDSDQIEVGEQVIAIGNPLFELTFTMTVGYVSALDREINIDGTPINMLQTDAAINSGNSGGPLFDMNGNVIGITTAKRSGQSSTGASIESINFAIPVNDAMRIVYDIQEYGYVKNRPYLGITTKDLDSATANNYGLPVGSMVRSVTEGSCAEAAGLQEGDIITALNERKVGCYTDLVAALNKHKAGDTIVLTVYRGGAELNLPVTLDERPKDLETKVPDETAAPDTQAPSESSPTNPENGQDSMPFDFNWPFGFGFGFGG